ncbi:hypothetical protein [Parageobacillus thermoglucosidasius]|uniref:hypothetical protein n=1 Tax=Parageobacillus thermoglucosidasius TaxID=1426 RepID=UPI000E1694F1|nr:hypothetical protein [Parageobacillus thermoglucosidasius]MED4904109.1 hypothetical protein [Parageobacillus thermoglucosidasius]MED4915659.1 hypothetical protein [Parageobacillus thermoglucosidasius]MED4945076.1 hypothetical protein [Parageobacillus thermoglucosidasius]MED4983727.1 hypothetical protein [Parageobacillus thermoglucosidasius]RDE19330.1 hypothetical protein DV714_20060 [Parageobacillus thermoglucosidasius]
MSKKVVKLENIKPGTLDLSQLIDILEKNGVKIIFEADDKQTQANFSLIAGYSNKELVVK